MQSPNVMTDGTISYTFSSRGAQHFFCNLLKTQNTQQLSVVLEQGRFLVYNHPTVQTAPFSSDGQGRPRWLLDLVAIPQRGTMVPQTIYIPRAPQDLQKHVVEARLQMPIFFFQSNGAIGVPLSLAASKRTAGLLYNESQVAPMGDKSTTHFCLNVSIYFCYRRALFLTSVHRFTVARLSRIQEAG